MAHLRNGPKDALAFHGSYKSSRQDKVIKIMLIRKVLSLNANPVYLSFPSGNNSVLKGRFYDGEWTVMESYVPTMFLRDLEEERAIVSFDNIKMEKRYERGHELLRAKTFFDVQRGKVIDLEGIRQKNKRADWFPIKIDGTMQKTYSIPQMKNGQDELVFFIRGKAELLFLIDNRRLISKQTYGQSYQMFLLKLDEEDGEGLNKKEIKVDVKGNEVYFVGPLIF